MAYLEISHLSPNVSSERGDCADFSPMDSGVSYGDRARLPSGGVAEVSELQGVRYGLSNVVAAGEDVHSYGMPVKKGRGTP